MSTDFEKLLRDDLRDAAESVDVDVSLEAVLDAAARARVRQRLARLGLAVLAVLVAAALWWATGLGAPSDRAIPDPLQRPTATATPSPAAPDEGVSATLMVSPPDTYRPGEQPYVRATLRQDGRSVDFVAANDDGPVGATRTVELPAGAGAVFTVGFPMKGYVLAVLRADADWIEPVQTGTDEWVLWDFAASGLGGTDLHAVAIRYREPADEAVPDLVWGDAEGRVYDSEGREIPAAVFTGPGETRTFFVDDTLNVAGVSAATTDVGGQAGGEGTTLVRSEPAVGEPGVGVRLQMAVSETTRRQYLVGGVLPAGATGLTATLDAEASVVIPLATAPSGASGDLLFYGEWAGPGGADQPIQPVDVRYTDRAGREVVLDVWAR